MSVEFLLLVLLGGLLALDGTSVGQFMVSRPLVAGTLAGWVAGDLGLGLAVGITLELLLLASFPVGGARAPEGATGAVAGAAAAAGAGGAPGLALGVLVGLLTAEAAGATLVLARRANGYLVPDPRRRDGPGEDGDRVRPGTLTAGHLGAVALDFLRASSVVAVGAWAGASAAPLASRWWPLSQPETAGLLMVGVAVPLGALLRAEGGFRRNLGFFLAGLGVAALTLALGGGFGWPGGAG